MKIEDRGAGERARDGGQENTNTQYYSAIYDIENYVGRAFLDSEFC